MRLSWAVLNSPGVELAELEDPRQKAFFLSRHVLSEPSYENEDNTATLLDKLNKRKGMR